MTVWEEKVTHWAHVLLRHGWIPDGDYRIAPPVRGTRYLPTLKPLPDVKP